MSEIQPRSETDPPPRRPWNQSKFWIAASLTLSIILLAWTISLPLRTLARPAAEEQLDPIEKLQQKRTRAELLRAEAFANHREFLREVAIARAAPAPDKPGLNESRAHWQQQRARIEIQLKELEQEQPAKGTLQWQALQSMRNSLEDGPG